MNTFFIILVGCCFACLIRAWLGKSIPDRMVAIDIMGILAVGMTALMAVTSDLDYLMDVVLAWIFLSFIGTLALAKYLAHKTLDE
jgi:multicomponent Na+:H+ antiporter subunit F